MGQRRTRLLAVGFGVLVLLGMEILARLILGAPSAGLFAEVPTASSTLTRTEGDTLIPLYQQDFGGDPIPLTPQTRARVVWMGGSSIRGGNPGMPLEREAAQLAGRMAGLETVNMAGPGLDSGHHLSLLPDVLALSPRVVVIYAGHNDLGNEVLMARYSGDRFLRIARLRWALRHSRIFSAMERTLQKRAVLRLPDHTMRPQFTVDEPLRAQIHDGYRQRIGALVDALREAGVVVVLATPTSNPASPSLEWQCPDALAQLGLPTQAPEALPVRHLRREDVAALNNTQDCADLRWLLARIDQDAEALDALRDTDPLPFRADRALVQLVRDLAAEHGALLADSNARFRQLGGGIEHPALFDDPMHLSESGHKVLANVVAEVLAEALRRPFQGAASVSLPPVDLAACGDLPCRMGVPQPLR